MIPTSLQKRRAGLHSLRIGFAMGGVALLLFICTLAIAYIIADRAFTKVSKLALVSGLIITALLGFGMVERFRR